MGKLIFFTALFYIVYRFISKFLNLYVVNSLKKKSKNKKHNQKKEGDVSIDKMPKNKKKSNNNLGDYVDYEELD